MEKSTERGGTAWASSGGWEFKGVFVLYKETVNALCMEADQREEVWEK